MRTRILVVDDDHEVATSVALVLAPRFEVVTIDGVARALALLRCQAFDVVLSDVTMPELSGLDLLRILRAERPEIAGRLVLMTGGCLSCREDEILRHERVPILAKPFALCDLEREIASIMRRRSDERRSA